MPRFHFFRISCSLTILFLKFQFLTASIASVSVNSEAAVLLNYDTGAFLYEKNAKKRFYPASITKIATVAYALQERGDKLNKVIFAEQEALASLPKAKMEQSNYTLPSYWLTTGAAHIGIKRGEGLTLKDLSYGTMVASGCDSANVIAQYIGGSIPVFMKLLNEHLKSIGCLDTTFKNPHGLHHPQHQTTAYDMAILTREAMHNPTFREIVKTVRYTRPATNKQKESTLIQTNQLLKRGKFYYPKAIGVKTGYTSEAQNTFVAAAEKDGRLLIAVLLNGKERADVLSDSIKLFEEAFKEKKVEKQLLPKGLQNQAAWLNIASKQIRTYTKEALSVSYYPSEMPKIKCLLCPEIFELPVKKDEKVGVLRFEDEKGKIIATQTLYAVEDVKESFLDRIKNFFNNHR